MGKTYKTGESSLGVSAGLYDSDSEEYEGTYIDFLDGSESRALFDIVNKVNYGFGGIGFITNFIHFLILFSKDLRGNFIYILMIGICICDMFMLGTFCLDFVFFWVYDDEYDKSCMESVNYYHIHVRAVGEYVKETTRRSSLVLALLMAFFRTISVMFPLSPVISKLMKPTFAVLMVVICIAICTISDALKYSRVEIWDAACPNQYFLTWNTRDNTFIDTEQLIDAIFTIGIVSLYICVTIALVVQLKIAHQRRKNLKTDKSENTSKLVFVMTITYLIAEVFFAVLSFLEVNDFLGSVIVWLLHTYAQHIKWSVMAVNSTVHCFICLLMSSQYRNNARQMFWREKQKGSPPIMELATVSTVKKGKTSGSRTY